MEIILSLILIFARFMDILTTPIYNFLYRNKRQYLPPINNDLLSVSACEIADKIRKREISSQEICQIYIDRIKEVNPIINAVVEDRFSEAIKEARQVDSILKITSLGIEELKKIKPLLGVPMTVKESCAVKGMSLAVGLVSRKGIKADHDCEAVARIKRAGAIVLAVTATPELDFGWETVSSLNGHVNNPYDTTCSAGGSSGGEAAIIGGGASVLGLGSEVGGSIRLSALFNGIFGHTPTSRVTPIKGHFAIKQNDKHYNCMVTGPMARHATDLRLLMRVLAGSRLSIELRLNEPVDLSQLNVYFLEDMGFRLSEPYPSDGIRAVILESVKHLKKCGATVQDYKFEDFRRSQQICFSTLLRAKQLPNLMKAENTFYILEVAKALFGKSRYTLHLLLYMAAETILKFFVGDYSAETEKLKRVLEDKLGTNGIIILPSFIGTAHKHNQFFFKVGYTYLGLANALGLPATGIPCGFDENGMPVGIQIIAGPNQDRLGLAIAEELERYFGGWIPPPEKN